jgi:hypothetical protein
MAQPNQFTKAREAGEEPPKASNQYLSGKRDRLDPATRDKIRAEKAASALEAIIDDPESTAEQRAAAAKALLPYGKSTYASIIEQQLEAPVNEEETAAQLAHIIASNPAILRPLLDAAPGLRAALRSILDGQPVPVECGVSAETAPQQDRNDHSGTARVA